MKKHARFVVSLAAIALVAALFPSAIEAAKAKVDLNSATQQELEALPGVGEATAKKIIAGRPYSSVGDLSKAGVSQATIDKISGLVKVGRSAGAKSAPAPAAGSGRTGAAAPPPAPASAPARSASSSPSSPSSSTPVDLNTASQKDLEALPGVGEATAKKIMAGRPYASVADLSRAGVSASTIQKISPMVTVSGSRAASSSRSAGPSGSSNTPKSGAAAGGLVDLNAASQKDLEALPGVGEVTAKKIVGGRPYSSVADLSRAGVSQATINKISSMVTVSGGRTASSSAPVPPGAPGASSKASSAPAQYQPPPSPGMVWVNTETKIFHREGDRWYGKTKKGKYMSESEAVKAGYRLSKEKDEPK